MTATSFRPLLFSAGACLMVAMMSAQTAEPRTVDKGDFSNVDDTKQVVVRTEAEWRALWRQHGGERARPSIDFGKEMVVGVFMGSRPTAGYDIAITKTLEKDGVLRVFYREKTPAPGLMLAQVLTFPFHLVAVPRTATEVKFEKEN